MQIDIPADQLIGIAEKIVRGCEFVLATRIIEEPYRVGIYFVHEHNVPDQMVRIFNDPNAHKTELGPGFHVTRAAAHDEPGTVVYRIVVWRTLTIYASVIPKEPSGEWPDECDLQE